MIPKTYEEWHYCLTKRCNITLSQSFIQERLAALNDIAENDTRRIITLYGDQHHENLKLWFSLALKDQS